MDVPSDFFLYGSGVYRKTNLAKGPTGFHSVKIIGWGEENGTPYWVSELMHGLINVRRTVDLEPLMTD